MYTEQKHLVGAGDPAAPVGTAGWADRMRLRMQTLLKRASFEPTSLASAMANTVKHRAWTMMNREDGTYFTEFHEFCETRTPYGLGRPWREIADMLVPHVGAQGLQLIMAPVRPDARQENGSNRERDEFGHLKGRKNSDDSNSRSDCENRLPPRSEQYIQAILRAPEQIQSLYREGRISQVAAAKLGPRPPKRGLDPDKAARIAEVTQTALALASQGADMRTVSKAVVEGMGGRRDPVERVLRLIAELDADAVRELGGRLPAPVRRALAGGTRGRGQS